MTGMGQRLEPGTSVGITIQGKVGPHRLQWPPEAIKLRLMLWEQRHQTVQAFLRMRKGYGMCLPGQTGSLPRGPQQPRDHVSSLGTGAFSQN